MSSHSTFFFFLRNKKYIDSFWLKKRKKNSCILVLLIKPMSQMSDKNNVTDVENCRFYLGFVNLSIHIADVLMDHKSKG